MKRCLAALEHDNHPAVKPTDYQDAEQYTQWKKREIQQLNQLIAHSVTADPRLLQTSSTDGYAPGQQREFITGGVTNNANVSNVNCSAIT